MKVEDWSRPRLGNRPPHAPSCDRTTAPAIEKPRPRAIHGHLVAPHRSRHGRRRERGGELGLPGRSWSLGRALPSGSPVEKPGEAASYPRSLGRGRLRSLGRGGHGFPRPRGRSLGRTNLY